MIELGFRNIKDEVKYIHIKPHDTELANVWITQFDRLLETHQKKIFQKLEHSIWVVQQQQVEI